MVQNTKFKNSLTRRTGLLCLVPASKPSIECFDLRSTGADVQEPQIKVLESAIYASPLLDSGRASRSGRLQSRCGVCWHCGSLWASMSV